MIEGLIFGFLLGAGVMYLVVVCCVVVPLGKKYDEIIRLVYRDEQQEKKL